MRMLKWVLALVASLTVATVAQASVVVRVDKTSQTMRVIVDGEHRYTWAVSTGRMGYNTPNGSYRPQRLERMWHSRKYGMAPMPHSIFFRGGYAIHGTNQTGRLGQTASHGCIRLAPGNARTLFEMVRARRGSTRIVIEGTARHSEPMVASRRSSTRVAAAPARTAQMRMAASGQVRAVRQVNRAERAAQQRRAAARASRPAVVQPVRVAPSSGNSFFQQWYLRR